MFGHADSLPLSPQNLQIHSIGLRFAGWKDRDVWIMSVGPCYFERHPSWEEINAVVAFIRQSYFYTCCSVFWGLTREHRNENEIILTGKGPEGSRTVYNGTGWIVLARLGCSIEDKVNVSPYLTVLIDHLHLHIKSYLLQSTNKPASTKKLVTPNTLSNWYRIYRPIGLRTLVAAPMLSVTGPVPMLFPFTVKYAWMDGFINVHEVLGQILCGPYKCPFKESSTQQIHVVWNVAWDVQLCSTIGVPRAILVCLHHLFFSCFAPLICIKDWFTAHPRCSSENVDLQGWRSAGERSNWHRGRTDSSGL